MVYEKWSQFNQLCLAEKLKEGTDFFDPEGVGNPCENIVGNILDLFIFKVVKKLDSGEIVNFRSALTSVYKRKFLRVEE